MFVHLYILGGGIPCKWECYTGIPIDFVSVNQPEGEIFPPVA